MIALLTGGAWIFYFTDAPTLLGNLLTGQAHPVAYITMAILTGTTFLFGGFAREQICIYACPWPRIQSAMLDDHSLVVTYQAWRGDRRGAKRKSESWDDRTVKGLGDCIDCSQCVQVCPMGIDIRDGWNGDCINCGLCVDACAPMMDTVGRPRGLISYDTLANSAARAQGRPTHWTPFRPRTIVYALILLVVGGVIATILFALVATRIVGRQWRFALLTGGSVAICGASAAMAIAAVLPRHEKSERDLVFTVLAVTVLSTVAMVLYPMLAQAFAFDARDSGVFLGGTIHDVAQVVGAGFSISPEAGETATLVKLIRVAMLAPVVLIFSLLIRGRGLAALQGGRRPPLLPGFVLGFLALATLNSIGMIPATLADLAGALSRWALLVAIAAVGIKTSLGRMVEVGGGAIALLIAETLFLGVFVVTGLHFLS